MANLSADGRIRPQTLRTPKDTKIVTRRTLLTTQKILASSRRQSRHEPAIDGNPVAEWKGRKVFQRENNTFFVRRMVPSHGKERRFNIVQVLCAGCGIKTFTGKRHHTNRSACSKACEKIIRSGVNNHNFSGGRKSKRGRKGGHILLYSPQHPFRKKNYVPEHRVVMEQEINRYLTTKEIVHHIDMNPTNNAPDNLALCADSKGHFLLHGSLNGCVAQLISMGALTFDRQKKRYKVRMRYIIAIDPGLSGALAVLTEQGRFVKVFDTPIVTFKTGRKSRREHHEQAIWHLIRQCQKRGEVTHAFIERQQPIPYKDKSGKIRSSGSMGVFASGVGYGLWRMALSAAQIPYTIVGPAEWKRHFRLLGADKEASRLKAIQLFPKADLRLKKHEGRSEALLIAAYGRTQLHGALSTS